MIFLLWRWFLKIQLNIHQYHNLFNPKPFIFSYGYQRIWYQLWLAPRFSVFFLTICKSLANNNIKQPLLAIYKLSAYKILPREWKSCDLLMYSLFSVEEMCTEITLLNVYQLRRTNQRKFTTCILIDISSFQTCNVFFQIL